MSNLSNTDLQNILSALEILHGEVNPLTLPERTLNAVFSLIPNEITAAVEQSAGRNKTICEIPRSRLHYAGSLYSARAADCRAG